MKLSELKQIVAENIGDSRAEFKETWLMEMPGLAGMLDTFPSLLYSLNDLLKHGTEKIRIENNIFKTVAGDIGFYWIEKDEKPVLIVEIKIKSEAIQLNMLGKSSDAFGNPPFASDLYSAILTDTGKSVLMSDEYLTDNSFAVWAKLLKLGKQISVYDVRTSDLQKVDSEEILKSYYHSTGNRFRFILSENSIREGIIRVSFQRFKFRKENNIS